MASGIAVHEEISSLYNEVKLRSTNKYIIMKIQDKKEIIIEFLADPVKCETKEQDRVCFNELKAKLMDAGEPRYVLYDFDFKMEKDGRTVKKLAFLFYCPDDSKIGLKMIYASSKDALKKQFVGLGLEFQANDSADLDYDDITAEVERKA